MTHHEMDTDSLKFEDFIGNRSVYPRPKKGICLILNVEQGRQGSDQDTSAIMKIFTDLKYTVKSVRNPTADDVFHELGEIARAGESYDCSVCFCLGHGDANGNMTVVVENPQDEKKVSFLSMFKILKNSTHWHGKPKIWFIQACRGSLKDTGFFATDEEQENDLSKEWDALYVFATIQDYVAWRNEQQGSVFIQTLCEALNNENCGKESLISLLPHLNKYINSKKIKKLNENYYIQEYIQVMQFTSTLRGDLYLTEESLKSN